MKMKNVVIPGLLIAGLVTGSVFAQDDSKADCAVDKDRKGKMFQELNLSPEQQTKMKENRETGRQEMQALRTTLKEKQAALREALKQPTASKESVAAIVNEIKSAQNALIDHRVDAMFAAKAIMTPEQYAKFCQLTQEYGGQKGGKKWRERQGRGEKEEKE